MSHDARRSDDTEANVFDVASVDPTDARLRNDQAHLPGPPE